MQNIKMHFAKLFNHGRLRGLSHAPGVSPTLIWGGAGFGYIVCGYYFMYIFVIWE